MPARLLRALGGVEEDGDPVQRLRSERAELRHHVVPELRRIRDVGLEGRHALPLRTLGAEVGRAEIAAARTEIRVAGGAARRRERIRAGDRLLGVREALALR